MPRRTRVVTDTITNLGDLRAAVAECRDLDDTAEVHAAIRVDWRSRHGARLATVTIVDQETPS